MTGICHVPGETDRREDEDDPVVYSREIIRQIDTATGSS